MTQEIASDIVAAVEKHGWLVPSPHELLAEGGGAHVYLCYKRDLVSSLEAFARSTSAIGQPRNHSRDLGCRALASLHHALIVDKAAVGVLKAAKSDKGDPRRARREIEAMQKLSARGLANLLAADEADPARWMVMQYYPRGPIAKSPDLFKGNPVVVLRGALQIAKALVAIHGLPLVHRDIKPSNIFLGDNGEWILGDFGIALEVDRTRLTKPEEVLWSRDWMPDWMTDRPLADSSPVVDVYMLVLTAYSMITGRKPRASQMDDPEFDLSKTLPDAPHVSTIGDFFTEHIVSKEKNVASQSAAALCERLERLLARLDDRETFLPLFSFVSSHTTTDLPPVPSGRPFTAMVINPRPSRRIAVTLRGHGPGGRAVLRLTLGDQQHSLPIPEELDGWNTFTGIDLGAPLPEGPLTLKAEPSGGSISAILIWAA